MIYFVLPLERFPVIGISCSSVLQHNHSPMIVIIPNDNKFVSHHDNNTGNPP